jgi:hypothetical protein
MFTIGAVFTSALGIGVNLAVFCAIDRVLFRELPYGEVDRLVLLRSCRQDAECAGGFPSIVAFEARARLTSVAGIAVAGMPGVITLDRELPPVRLSGSRPSASMPSPPSTFHNVSTRWGSVWHSVRAGATSGA